MVSSFGITALHSRKNKEIDLCSDYTNIKFYIRSHNFRLRSWNLAYNVDQGLEDQPRYTFSPAVTYAWAYKGSFFEETAMILFMSTTS